MDYSKEQRLAIMVLVALSLAALGAASAKRHLVKPGGDVQFVRGGVNAESASSRDVLRRANSEKSSSGTIYVHVAGHVKKPGLYKLDSESRIYDAWNLAGGAVQGADLNAINLAAKLEDGLQVYVPTVKETKSAPSPQSMRTISKSRTPGPAANRIVANNNSGSKLTSPGQGSVNINTAGLGELQRLPGVGPATAQKILDHRATIGQFKTVDSLMDVKGIGPAKLEKMRPFVEI